MIVRPSDTAVPDDIFHDPSSAGRIIQITGEPWTGKTRLLAQLSAQARDKSYAVASGRARRCRSGHPFEPFVDALDRYIREGNHKLSAMRAEELALLDEILPSVDHGNVGRSADTHAERAHAFAAICRLLEHLAGESGLIVALDDFHRADDQSIELLAYLSRNPPRSSVVIMVAYRLSLSGRRINNIMDRARSDGAAYIELKPLPADQIDALFPPGVSPVRKGLVRRDARGNPGALLSLLSADPEESYAADDLIDGHPPLVEGRSLIDFGALSPLARRVAAAAAVSGDPFDPGIIKAVAELPEEAVLAAIDELQDEDVIRPAQAIGRFRFQHPVARAIVYHSVSAGWCYGAQSRAAQVLGSRGASSSTLASHLEHLTDDETSARKLLLEGAKEMLCTMPARAKRWLSRLLETDGEETAEASLLLAKAYALLGRLPESLRLYAADQLLADAIPANLRADAVEWRVRVHRLMGLWDAARRLVEEELRVNPGSIPLGLERVALSIEAGDLTPGPGARVPPAAVHTPDLALCAQALSMRALTHLARRHVADAAEAVTEAAKVVDELEDDQLADRMETLRWLGEAEMRLRQFPDAVAHLQRGLRFAILHGQGYLQSHFSLALSRVYAEFGDIGAAAAELDYAEDAALRSGTEPVRAQVAMVRARIQRAGANEAGSGTASPDGSTVSGRPPGSGEPTNSSTKYGIVAAGQPGRNSDDLRVSADSAQPTGDLRLLSRRERQVANLVSLGYTNHQIAHRLELSQKTVETYLSRIFKKLEISSRAQIAHAVGRADMSI